MKTIPPPCPHPETGPKYWRGLDELAETPEFQEWVEREFPAGASEMTDPVTRRHFVKIMSASFLLAGLGTLGTGCRKPEEKIYPFSKMPENYTHGVAQFYATSMPTRSGAVPLLVKSSDGRPTKVEGNPQFPDGNGGSDRFAQASILNLYDPDRAQGFKRMGAEVQRERALNFLGQISRQSAANGGRGLAFLLEPGTSPSRARLQKLVAQKFPQAAWFSFDPLNNESAARVASTAAGRPTRVAYNLQKARVLVSLDADILGNEEEMWRNIPGFSRNRKVEKDSGEMNRLYVLESLMTLTGASADHRLRLAPSAILPAAARLAQEVLKQSGGGELAADINKLAADFKGDEKWIVECAQDLSARKGNSIVLAGRNQPLSVHAIALALNQALGNVGQTVLLQADEHPATRQITDLAADLKSGKVDTLIILGGNPVYTAPSDLIWKLTQRQARVIVRLGFHEDETASETDWHLPAAHYLESWGDARTGHGALLPVQPLIQPLFNGVTELEVLARVGGFPQTNPYDIVRETFFGLTRGNEEDWKRFLHDGFLATPEAAAGGDISLNLGGLRSLMTPVAAAPGLEVAFFADYKVEDGRYNNNGWLQEFPDPITKIVWDNAILVGPGTARALAKTVGGLRGIEVLDDKPIVGRVKDLPGQTEIVELEIGARKVRGPIWIVPGMAENTVGVALGYGRERTGRIGRGTGFNGYLLRTTKNLHYATGAKISKTADFHRIATTQSHWSLEGRPIVREANLEDFRKHPKFAKAMDMEQPPGDRDAQGRPLSLYPNPLDAVKGAAVHAWGMSIDLGACVGCGACTIACQSENNVPIVGKDQVTRGREMHWIRIDRYFSGKVEDPQLVNQPMLCQHCEAAPCENVCPVNATVHDEEGLNLMVYNRCVGTRYCSNNCPYKVRRFNFFDYNKRPLDQLYKGPLATRPDDEFELMKLVRNPDVTVRMRGVMEKCTFCLQRIEGAKIAQKVAARDSGDIMVKDKAFTTACAQACPAEAIVFGNLKDPNSRVSKLKESERDYAVLDFLLTKPRLTYLARIRNPNLRMPDYQSLPWSVKEYSEKNENPFAEEGAAHEGAAAGHSEKASGKAGHE